MRPALYIALISLVAAAAACNARKKNPPPEDRFYFPSGIHHARTSDAGEGVLYVVSANFDRRFDNGMLTAVDLDAVGLPPFGTSAGGTPVQLTDLKVSDAGGAFVQVSNFGGDLGVGRSPSGGVRLFIPSRSEQQKLVVVDAVGNSVSCVPTVTSDGGMRMFNDARDCGEVGVSLVEFERTPAGVPRADSPMTVTVSPDGRYAWVSSGRHADSPRFSTMNFNDYVVRVRLGEPAGITVDAADFIAIGAGSTHGVAVGQRWVYFSGRFPSVIVNPPLLRLVSQQPPHRVIFPNLEADVKIGDARGIALSTDERRLFLAGRQASGVTGSDVLVVASITNAASENPIVAPLRTVPVPTEPLMVQALSRGPGRGDLVVVTCGGGGSLVIYDDERGDLAAQVDGLGLQPSSFAIDRRGNGARIYVTNFQDGRVAVVDVPDLDLPQSARIVAHLGASQVCLTRNLACDGGFP